MNGCSCSIIKSADEVNLHQRELFIGKILNKFGENLTGMVFAIWGLAFKPKTNDMRMAPSITEISALLEWGAKIIVYDPQAKESAKKIFGDKIEYGDASYSILSNADALILLTEWNEFRNPDFERIKSLMKKPIIFDGRNQYDRKYLGTLGFEYYQV